MTITIGSKWTGKPASHRDPETGTYWEMMPANTTKHTADRAAVVDTSNRWKRVDRFQPPNSGQLLLIDRRLGVAVRGTYSPGSNWTHWAGMPTFDLTDDYFGDAK